MPRRAAGGAAADGPSTPIEASTARSSTPAQDAVRGPLETCPGCRITFAVPAAIACAKAGELDRAADYEKASEYLAHVVMRLPAWDAAYHEVRGHISLASGDVPESRALFATAADGYASGQPLDPRRGAELATAG